MDAPYREGTTPWSWSKVFSPPGQLSVEFVNVDGAWWFGVGFLWSVQSHVRPGLSVINFVRLVLVRIRLLVVMLGLGLSAWRELLLPCPLLLLLSLRIFRLGWALRVTLFTGEGGLVHLFVVYGYQGAEEDSEKFQLTDRLLQAVLAEAQVVCLG